LYKESLQATRDTLFLAAAGKNNTIFRFDYFLKSEINKLFDLFD
jgi:hypothetical protein